MKQAFLAGIDTEISRTHPGGMLAIWHDVAEGSESEIRTWYSREHHFERLSVPGFLEARRHDKVEGEGPAIMCLYGVESPRVLASEAYRARLAAPSEWTLAVMPHYRNMSRTVCAVTGHGGVAQGGIVASLTGADGTSPAVETVREALSKVPGVLRWCCIVAADAAPAAPTAEAALRGQADDRIAWGVMVDAHDIASGRAALRALQACVEAGQRAAIYQLAFAARSSDSADRTTR